jgi:eukaryotic-like serine/threonine-protein kinase
VFRRRRRVDETAEQPAPGRYVQEEVVEPPRRRRPLIWPWLLLLLLLVLGGLALGYFLTRDDDEESAARVPDVVGFSERMAVIRLDREGYRSDVRRQLNPNRQAGRVFDQEPDAGTEFERGEQVVVFVARGLGTVGVPRVVGMQVTEAFETLQAARLRGDAREVFSRVRPGAVIRQQPAPGTQVPRGKAVVLTVSRGRQTVTVPDLIGRTEAEAGASLQRLGLRAVVVRVPTREQPGTVIAQRPTAGQRVPRGAAVQINVSRGAPTPTPTRATVPDVVRRDEVTAQDILRAAGFTTQVVDRPTTDPAQDGIVLEQRPAAGQRAPRGSRVVLTVGRLS